jgi:AcrR family transcriptional regulator
MPTSPLQRSIPARTRGPRRDAAENRAALIQAAATLLNRDPSASLEAIAAEAGLSRRSVYGHFATRDALLAELAASGAARVNAAMLSVAATLESPAPAVQLAAVGARLGQEVDPIRVMALHPLRGPQSRVAGGALEPLRSHVRAIVERGVASGRFRSDIEPGRLSRLIESAAISVLDEANRHDVPSDEGRRLVVLSVLAIAGFGHVQAAALFDDVAAHTSITTHTTQTSGTTETAVITPDRTPTETPR